MSASRTSRSRRSAGSKAAAGRVPRLARSLVLWSVDPTSAEFIVGDLDEAFCLEAGRQPVRARWRYWRLALASIWSRRSGRRQDPAGHQGAPMPGARRSSSLALTGELRYALRRLRRSPAFTAMAVLTLALGIGAGTAVFSVLNGVLLRPLPYDDPGEVVNVWQVFYEWMDSDVPAFRARASRFNASYPVFLAWRERGHVFEGVAAYNDLDAVVEGTDIAEWVPITEASAGLFEVLGVEPQIGRGFRPEEDVAGGERVVVLSHGFWMERFGGNPGVLGRELSLTGVPHTIVGVMPPGFWFPQRGPQLWMPLRDSQRYDRWSRQSMQVVARLRDGVSLRQAQLEMDAMTLQILEDNPDSPEVGIRLVGRVDEIAGSTSRTLTLLLGAVGLVLVVTAANLAGLLMVRLSGRRCELAVRRALGAGRLRLAAQSTLEGLLLVMAGGALGLAVTAGAMGGIKSRLPATIPRIDDIAVDGRVLAFTAAVSLLVALAFGAASVLGLGRDALSNALRAAGRGGAANRRVGRSLLVVGEVTVAVVLLVAASLLLTSYLHLTAAERGFDQRNVLTFDVGAPLDDWGDTARVGEFYRRALASIEQVPGVRSAATVSSLPFGGGTSGGGFGVRDGGGELSEAWSLEQTVTPGYFETMGVALLRGRLFDETDRPGSEKVAIINQRLADTYWPDSDPIGASIEEEDGAYTVVGVVADNKHGSLAETVERMRYRVAAQDPDVLTSMVVRTEVPPNTLAAAMRDAIRAVAASATISDIASLAVRVDRTAAMPRFRSAMLSGLAAIAMILATLGLYGVVALSVTERRREIGVRMTLGAQRRDIVRQVLGGGVRLIVAGVALGMGVAAAGLRLIEGYVFEVPTTDPATFAGVALAVLAIGVLATWVPARRASGIEPLIVLRSD